MNNAGGGGADERLWKPEVDKTGNGYTVIRFLPSQEGEDIPWAKMYSRISESSGWYIENSLTTTGGKILFQNTIVNSGTVVMNPIRILFVSKNVSCLTTQISTL